MWQQSIGYEIQELLGEGSQGKVFKALRRDPATSLTQILAIKILHSENAVDLWKREFESLSKVRSPYCVQVHGFERIRRRPALILEYVDGVSLAALGKSCWLDDDEILEILAQTENAILDLYKYGTFHGDLSPHNILVDKNGFIRLLDFGLANCSGNEVRLTPDFAAPERLCGAKADLASDIFSIGRLEQVLRGQEPTIDPQSPYLKIEPSQRSLRGLFSEPERRNKLAHRVQLFQARKKCVFGGRTRTVIRKKSLALKPFWIGALALCIVLLTPNSARTRSLGPSALLRIRTHHWHYFLLNGSPLGYAPIDVAIEAAKSHQLTWISEKSRGEKQIQVENGRGMELRDRDF